MVCTSGVMKTARMPTFRRAPWSWADGRVFPSSSSSCRQAQTSASCQPALPERPPTFSASLSSRLPLASVSGPPPWPAPSPPQAAASVSASSTRFSPAHPYPLLSTPRETPPCPSTSPSRALFHARPPPADWLRRSWPTFSTPLSPGPSPCPTPDPVYASFPRPSSLCGPVPASRTRLTPWRACTCQDARPTRLCGTSGGPPWDPRRNEGPRSRTG
mmetsp:Transcript_11610/g.32663  ORF Transcript_11610/g.32663 Transcript_11610/m.32663 type:complete len:216 (-) Transcript_11610:166-813(-)